MENKVFRLKKIKAQVRQFAPVLFLLVSLGLVGIGVSQNPYLIQIKTAAAQAFTPIISVISAPLRWGESGIQEVRNLWNLRADNEKLRAENRRLLAWKNLAYKISDDKKQLEKLMNYVPSKERSYLTARVLADNGGNFSRSLIVEAGSNNGLKKGAVAMLPEGVFGRIVEVGPSVSRLLLITDYSSRIPVMIGEQRILGILTGDNSQQPKVISLPAEGIKVSVGDRVVTSGHAGVYPSGLPIGTVSAVGQSDVTVLPFTAKQNPEFVRLVDFGLANSLIDDTPCVCQE